MSDQNVVAVTGNLCHDPELRYTKSEKPVCSFRIAVNSGWGDRQETVFIGVEAWGRSAEATHKFCSKGSKVAVDGRLKLNEWETKDGKRSEIRITANNVHFLPRGDAAPSKPSPEDIAPPYDGGGSQDDLPF